MGFVKRLYSSNAEKKKVKARLMTTGYGGRSGTKAIMLGNNKSGSRYNHPRVAEMRDLHLNFSCINCNNFRDYYNITILLKTFLSGFVKKKFENFQTISASKG